MLRFLKEERKQYIDALESANRGNLKPFVSFLANNLSVPWTGLLTYNNYVFI